MVLELRNWFSGKKHVMLVSFCCEALDGRTSYPTGWKRWKHGTFPPPPPDSWVPKSSNPWGCLDISDVIGNSQGSRVVGLENLPVGVFLVSTLWPFCGYWFHKLEENPIGTLAEPAWKMNVKVTHIFLAATPPKTNGWLPKRKVWKR